MVINPGDLVEVEYLPGQYFEGTVLWTKKVGGLDWATVRPTNYDALAKLDIAYQDYVYGHPTLGQVFPINR